MTNTYTILEKAGLEHDFINLDNVDENFVISHVSHLLVIKPGYMLAKE